MSGILAVVGPVSDARLKAALVPLRRLGGDRDQVWAEEDVLVVVTRKDWQLDDDFSGPVLVLESPDLVVAADASLFDKPALARRLAAAGATPRGESASHYLEAGYRTWGRAVVDHLDGDFAFIIWDRQARRLFAARDIVGGRPLFSTKVGAGIAVGSSCRALAELRGTAGDLNLANLGGLVAGLAWSHGSDTAYRGVDTLRAAHRMEWQSGRAMVEPWWQPAGAPERHPPPSAEAAEELRDLLADAVSRRLARGTTTVWMSGGWDSTAVFAAGQRGLAREGGFRLRPVSISYPVGDPGYEDEFINLVAAHWKAEVHWIRSDALGLLEGLEARAARWDEPPVHLYELWNRGLARGTRQVGSRIAFDGVGGDQLFQVSDIILADLLAAGRWMEFTKRARARAWLGWRHLVRLGLLPLVPDGVIRSGERLLGRRIPRHYLERSPTTWIRPQFSIAARLRERDLDLLRVPRGRSRAHTESMLYLSLPVWGCGVAFMRGPFLEEGVETRSPLLDRKLVEFALRRPVAERYSGTETKILLRKAMSGLLPKEVLAPRSHRTGATVGFSRQRMREAYPGLVARLLSEPLQLAELGIADAKLLRSAIDRYLAGDQDDFLRVNLFHTMKVEFWLRGQDRRAAGAPPSEVVSPAA